MTTTGGDTALHWASSAKRDDASDRGNLEERSLRVAELLLGAGADLRAKNQRGETPLDLATGNAVMALLLSASQELDKREEEEEVGCSRAFVCGLWIATVAHVRCALEGDVYVGFGKSGHNSVKDQFKALLYKKCRGIRGYALLHMSASQGLRRGSTLSYQQINVQSAVGY